MGISRIPPRQCVFETGNQRMNADSQELPPPSDPTVFESFCLDCLRNKGDVFAVRDQPEIAIEFYNQSVLRARSIGDPRSVASALRNMGRAFLQLQEYSQSLKCVEEALRIFEQTHDPAASGVRELVTRVREFKKKHNL